MNWKIEAVDKLKQYIAKKNSLENIPMEIEMLEFSMEGIRSMNTEGSSVCGSGGRHDDMYLSNITHRAELEQSRKLTERWVSFVEAGLKALTEEEQMILDRFYIHPEKSAADRLAGDLRIDVKTVYRRKDSALRHFTISLYGNVES